ncbi:hypothetical protein CER19_13345 [Pseudomonas sp. GL93]|nr:hypothetical protein CER19_13345 [Pseudomonas sp. GL93]
MIQALHEVNGDVGFLPRTTEYITFICRKGLVIFRDCWVFQIGPSEVFGEGVGAIFQWRWKTRDGGDATADRVLCSA